MTRAKIKTFEFRENVLGRVADETINKWLDEQPDNAILTRVDVGGTDGWIFYVLTMGYRE